MPVTLQDIAAQAGVSKMTVSKVLNGQPGISEATRARVLTTAQKLGYRANAAARTLATGRSDTLGVLVPSLGTQYVSEVVRGADHAATALGLDLLISTTQERPGREGHNVSRLSGGLVDALLIVLPYALHDYAPALLDASLPVVVVGNESPGQPLALVDTDHMAGARLAAGHLLDLGHRRIAFVTGRPDVQASAERLRGYGEALRGAGLPVDERLIVDGDYTQPGGFHATRTLLARLDAGGLPLPTAVFAANDVSAFGVIEALRDHGLRVPGDVSVIGFDDIPQASQVHPPLTTVRQPLPEMGEVAARMLIARLRGGPAPPPRTVLPPTLVLRASTAPRRPH
ncbi:LacI family DNA-binding transcriptional regulator [Deinococcus aerophilus]|uniref:LacI family transcriptional regulator n=1 Tax=Deinococcus aerophilus TaxID=522488 RepID=A0ABQ2GW61_9DEIO|nr:LacI family DNA-binding transcriptional regulator [Deinococcus aerophilus]GGM14457.1 LacI family transcriptional regulator [Deinococcus aerophilus]